MSFQDRICKAFCAEVKVNRFNGGFGVSTPFMGQDGDLLGYYVVGPSSSRTYDIMDNALTAVMFESEGASLDSDTRLSAFNEILAAYGAIFDEELGEIRIPHVREDDLERRALDFMALMLRLQDMYLLTQERTKSTFAEDVENRLFNLNILGLEIRRSTAVSERLADAIPDYLITKEGVERPLALFVASQNEKLWQAMYLKNQAEFETKTPLSVVALLQSDKIGSAQLRAKADNRLDAVPKWDGDEIMALSRVLRELEVPASQIH